MLKKFGDFEKEKVILKKLARQGQCFSGTKSILTLKPEEIEKIKDIERPVEEGKEDVYCFTDGIGNISSEIAAQIDEHFKLN